MPTALSCAFASVLGAALCTFGFVGPAEAAPAAGWLHRYEVVAECPTHEAAERRLDAHLGATTPAEPPSFALTVRGGAGEPFVGILETSDPSGARSRRMLADASCEEVVWSLVFVAALAVSPEARALPPTRAADPSPVAVPAAPAPAVTPPPSPSPSTPSADRDARESPRGGAANAQPDSLSIELGPQLRLGPLPALSYGLEARVSYGIAALAAGFVTSPEENASVGRARFLLVTARPQLCPLRSGHRLRVEGCAGLDVGILNASSEGLQGARSVPALWLAGEVSARAALDVAGPLFVALDLRGGVPFHRPSYITNPPEITVYEVPIVVGALGIFAGLSWK